MPRRFHYIHEMYKTVFNKEIIFLVPDCLPLFISTDHIYYIEYYNLN